MNKIKYSSVFSRLERNLYQCPLCLQTEIIDYHRDKRRAYVQCQRCQLVSVPGEYRLSPKAEKAEYDMHQNDPSDSGYRRFLSRTVSPLFERLDSKAVGLDFGCGPGPTISEMAKESGFKVHNYDIFYFNRPELLQAQYDFITMTEVIEHLSKPDSIVKKLDNLLKNKGILAVMTKRVTSPAAFGQWHYKNDPTHICFYSEETFEWIANNIGWRLEIIDKDVVFFHKE